MALLSAILTFPCPGAPEEEVPGTIEHVLANYGVLRTVAGNGASDDLNDWWDFNEGNPGTWADLSRPHMAMADAWGNVYIADKESHAIRRVAPDGVITTVAGSTEGQNDVGGFDGDGPALGRKLNNPNGLYTLPDGTTYIVDLGNDRIRKVTPGGSLTTVVFENDGLGGGRGLWVSPDQRLIYYTAKKKLRRWRWGRGTDTVGKGFEDPGNIDVAANGMVIVTDRNVDNEPGAHRVWRVNPVTETKVAIAGNGTTSGGGSGFPALATGLNQVRGIACDAYGGYFLCTMKAPAGIWYVDTSGIIHLLVAGEGRGSTHSGDGVWVGDERFEAKLSEPRSVALGPNGDLLIATNDQGYVRKVLSRSGTRAVERIELERDAVLGVTVRWASEKTRAYSVERMVPGGGWEEIGRVLGNQSGGETVFEDLAAIGMREAFYRVWTIGGAELD